MLLLVTGHFFVWGQSKSLGNASALGHLSARCVSGRADPCRAVRARCSQGHPQAHHDSAAPCAVVQGVFGGVPVSAMNIAVGTCPKNIPLGSTRARVASRDEGCRRLSA